MKGERERIIRKFAATFILLMMAAYVDQSLNWWTSIEWEAEDAITEPIGPVDTEAGTLDAEIDGGGNPCRPALAAAAVTPAKIPATVELGLNLALADSSLFSSSRLFKQALLGFMLRSVTWQDRCEKMKYQQECAMREVRGEYEMWREGEGEREESKVSKILTD